MSTAEYASNTAATPPGRIVIIVRDDLPAWRVANAAAVLSLSLTLGSDLPDVTGASIITADGIDLGPISRYAIPILTADGRSLNQLHQAARTHSALRVVALDEAMLTTNSYDDYAVAINARPADEFACFALILAGTKSAVRKVTGDLPLYITQRDPGR